MQANHQAKIRLGNARDAIESLLCRLDELEAEQDAQPNHWGITGTIGHIESKLRELVTEN